MTEYEHPGVDESIKSNVKPKTHSTSRRRLKAALSFDGSLNETDESNEKLLQSRKSFQEARYRLRKDRMENEKQCPTVNGELEQNKGEIIKQKSKKKKLTWTRIKKKTSQKL